MFPPNTTSPRVYFYNENALELTKTTEFKRTSIHINKVFNGFKEYTNNNSNLLKKIVIKL